MDENKVLLMNPFEGDIIGPGDYTLKDKIVTARKQRGCSLCHNQIIPGTRIRTITEKFEGNLQYYCYCNDCCLAMEKSFEDDGEEYEKRIILGERILLAKGE